jgi:electron transport complex protein RnfA
MIAKLMAAVLLALAADNLFFSGGMGFSRALRAARKPASAGTFTLWVTGFSLGSALAGHALAPLFPSALPVWFAAAMVLVCSAMYLLSALVLRRCAPAYFEKYSQIIAQAAANTAVVGAALSQETLGLGWAGCAGFALGTGAAFFLAVQLLERALRVGANPDMPRAFAGLPGALLYIGILSMAFAGFSGNVF